MRVVTYALMAGVFPLAIGWATAISTPFWFAPKTESQVDIHDLDTIARGEYIARAGDCIACHTAPGGAAFAGGLGLQTSMGTIYSTNITPTRKPASAAMIMAISSVLCVRECGRMARIFTRRCPMLRIGWSAMRISRRSTLISCPRSRRSQRKTSPPPSHGPPTCAGRWPGRTSCFHPRGSLRHRRARTR